MKTWSGDSEARTRFVSDAGPLIHLDEVDCLDVLDFSELLVPALVLQEVGVHRPDFDPEALRLPLIEVPTPPAPALQDMLRPYGLSAADRACLLLASARPGTILLTDDLLLRSAAFDVFSIEVHGSIGLILRSIRRGKRTTEEVKDILESIPHSSTLHLKPSLLKEFLKSL